MGWNIVLDPYVADLADSNVACQKIVSSDCSVENLA